MYIYIYVIVVIVIIVIGCCGCCYKITYYNHPWPPATCRAWAQSLKPRHGTAHMDCISTGLGSDFFQYLNHHSTIGNEFIYLI